MRTGLCGNSTRTCPSTLSPATPTSWAEPLPSTAGPPGSVHCGVGRRPRRPGPRPSKQPSPGSATGRTAAVASRWRRWRGRISWTPRPWTGVPSARHRPPPMPGPAGAGAGRLGVPLVRG